MKPTRKHIVTLIVAVVSVLAAAVVLAQMLSPFYAPPVVRMTGIVQPYDEKKSNELNTLTLTVGGTKILFRVSRMDTMTGSDPGMMLLDRIFPPELHLTGAPKNLAPLASSDSAGKSFTLEGFLYIADQNYAVASVTAATNPAQ
jgi:hypothetical protein